jgi:hypothetical protein
MSKKRLEVNQMLRGYEATVHDGETEHTFRGTTRPETRQKALDAIAEDNL